MHFKCGAQPIPELMLWNGIPTKSLLAQSQFSGKLLLSFRVPAQVLSTRFSGSAFLPYLLLLVKILSWLSLLFIIASVWLWASCCEMVLMGSSGDTSRILLHLSFQMRKALLDMIIRKRWEVPSQMCPSGVWIFRRGRAIMVMMSRFSG